MEKKQLMKPDSQEYDRFEAYGLEWTSDDTKDLIKQVITACVAGAVGAIIAICT